MAASAAAQDWIRTGTGLGMEKVRLAVPDFVATSAEPQAGELLRTFNDTLWNDLQQAGIFEMRGIPEAQLAPVLGIVCPGIVYPYLRANVADLVNRTGLPPIHLAEINFEALFQQKAAQAQAAATQTRQ